MSNNTIRKLISSVSGSGNIIAVNRLYVDLLDGDAAAAILLSQCVYWCDRTKRKDGFFYKSYDDWKAEIGLSEYQVRRVTGKLGQLGILEKKLKRANGAPTLHYKVDVERLTSLIIEKLDNQETQESDSLETQESDSLETQESLTETTHKTTHKTTLLQTEVCESDLQEKNTKPPKKTREPTKLDIAKTELIAYFEEITGLRLDEKTSPKSNGKLWWTPVTRIWKDVEQDTDRAKRAIQWAVDKMRKDDLTVSSPLSIQKVCMSEIARRRAVSRRNGNGKVRSGILDVSEEQLEIAKMIMAQVESGVQ